MDISKLLKIAPHKSEDRLTFGWWIKSLFGGYLDVANQFFNDNADDSKSFDCCDEKLSWGDIKGEHYYGTFAQCGGCKTAYYHKMPSDTFLSDNKSKLYVGKPCKDGKIVFEHGECGQVNFLEIILEDSEGVKMEWVNNSFIPVKERILYCPSHENVNPDHYPQPKKQDSWNYFSKIRKLM